MDARLATVLQKLSEKKELRHVTEWLETKNENAAKNFKRCVGKNSELNPIQLSKMKQHTLALLKKNPTIQFEYSNSSSHIPSWGGTRKLKKSKRHTRSQKRT